MMKSIAITGTGIICAIGNDGDAIDMIKLLRVFGAIDKAV